MPSIPSNSLFKTTFYPFPHSRIFFINQAVKVWLFQTRVAILPGFQHAKQCNFKKTGHWVVFIKIRTKHASKGGIELAIIKSLREVLVEALSLGFGVTVLVLVCLVTLGTFLVHTVSYDADRQAYNQAQELKAFIVELESEII
jgi:hypothetical protein